MKSKIIALSAISAAFSAIFLTVGAYFELADIFCIVLASIASLLPIYFKSYLGAFLSFLVGGVLAFLFSGFNFMSLVFVCYFGFGAYPLVSSIMRDKGVKQIIIFIIGIIWCCALFYGAFFYYVGIMNATISDLPKWITDNIYLFIGLFSVVFYFVFDRFIVVYRIFIDRYLKRIIK